MPGSEKRPPLPAFLHGCVPGSRKPGACCPRGQYGNIRFHRRQGTYSGSDPYFTEAYLTQTMTPGVTRTFYTRFGDFFSYLCMTCSRGCCSSTLSEKSNTDPLPRFLLILSLPLIFYSRCAIIRTIQVTYHKITRRDHAFRRP